MSRHESRQPTHWPRRLRRGRTLRESPAPGARCAPRPKTETEADTAI